VDEEGDPRRRRESFPTPLTTSKNLSKAPKVFIFVQKCPKILVET